MHKNRLPCLCLLSPGVYQTVLGIPIGGIFAIYKVYIISCTNNVKLKYTKIKVILCLTTKYDFYLAMPILINSRLAYH